ncbi:MAG: radical SAM protein [Candidatus Parcubacteria bacterium]|nr:radical SAM protein [Candidatus Parcubacteria bacterium]
MPNKEVFIVRDIDGIIIFAPLKGIVLRVKESQRLDSLQKLLEADKIDWQKFLEIFPEVVLPQKEIAIDKFGATFLPIDEPFAPTSVSLFTTFDCNLKCIYCYSEGGKRNDKMPWLVAKNAIDFAVDNALKQQKKAIVLEFHGGGEPTFNWPVLQQAIIYFREKVNNLGIKPLVKITSNGTLAPDKLAWLAKQINGFCLSFDGFKEIQDLQRPLKNGGSSFDKVYSTAKFLTERGIRFIIRVTVTEHNVMQLPQLVEFFCENFGNSIIDLEPLYYCGRCVSTSAIPPLPDVFIEQFIKAKKVAQNFNTEISFSGFNLTKLRRAFCGVTYPNFIVLPTGYITSCTEISDSQNPLADLFIYGKQNDDSFTLDQNKIRQLKALGKRIQQDCQDCFCQYHCAGDCLAKKITPQGENKSSLFMSERCQIIRGIAMETLKALLGERR